MRPDAIGLALRLTREIGLRTHPGETLVDDMERGPAAADHDPSCR
jgi:hypothetical protein